MNNRQAKTLAKIFEAPALANVVWTDIESLFRAVGCRVVEGAGSRVSFELRGHIESFHRPHPQKEAKRYQVRRAQDFLQRIGVEP